MPFLAPEQLFERFNQDLAQHVERQQLLEEREKRDVVERRYAGGARVLQFGNGTTKLLLPGGQTDIRFDNGDLKRVDGEVVVYYYSEVGTLFTQLPDDIRVYRFGNGQLERHSPDGAKTVLYPDGTVKRVGADGREAVEFRE